MLFSEKSRINFQFFIKEKKREIGNALIVDLYCFAWPLSIEIFFCLSPSLSLVLRLSLNLSVSLNSLLAIKKINFVCDNAHQSSETAILVWLSIKGKNKVSSQYEKISPFIILFCLWNSKKCVKNISMQKTYTVIHYFSAPHVFMFLFLEKTRTKLVECTYHLDLVLFELFFYLRINCFHEKHIS